MLNKMNCLVIFTLPVFFFTAYGYLGEDYSNHTAWQYFPEDCGRSRYDKKTTRIIKGDKAMLGEFPWMARLGRYLSNKELFFFCGGVLINRFYVLSAAHCEEKADLVRLGEHDAERSRDCENDECAPPHQDVKVKQYFFDNYCRSILHDIMVLELAKPVTFNDFVRPACILRQPITYEELVGKMFTLAGWGATNEDYSGPSRYLLCIFLKVLDKPTCEIKHYPFDDRGQICLEVTSKGQNVCKGDSGGPAIMSMEVDGVRRAYAFGVASYVLPNCRGGAVYTSILRYLNLILEVVTKS